MDKPPVPKVDPKVAPVSPAAKTPDQTMAPAASRADAAPSPANKAKPLPSPNPNQTPTAKSTVAPPSTGAAPEPAKKDTTTSPAMFDMDLQSATGALSAIQQRTVAPTEKDAEDLITAHEKEPETEKAPLRFDLDGIALSLCVFALLLDSHQLHMLHSSCRKHGGLFFLVSYVFVSLLVEFPLLQLMLHIGQFTRSGITRVFGMYGPVFRCVGWGMLIVTVMHQSCAIHHTAEKIGYLSSIASDPSVVVKCTYPKFDCSAKNNTRKTCCTSLYHGMQCRNSASKGSGPARNLALGKKCLPRIHESFRLRTASSLFIEKRLAQEKHSTVNTQTFLISAGVIVFFAACASSGQRIFTYILAGLCLLAVILSLVLVIAIFCFGSMGWGWDAMVRLSKPHRFLNVQIWAPMMQVVLTLTVVKFSIISIASFYEPKQNTFRVAYTVQFAQMFLMLLIFFAKMSMAGTFEKAVGQPTSYSQSFGESIYKEVVPEFFVSLGHAGFVHLYFIVGVLFSCGTISAPFFICFTLVRDHLSGKYMLVKNIAAVWILCGIQLVLPVYLLAAEGHGSVHDGTAVMEGSVGVSGALLLGSMCIVTVVVYGPLESLLDRASTVVRSESWLERIGSLSPVYPWIITNVLPPLLLMFASARALFLFREFKAHDHSIVLMIFDRIFLGLPLLATLVVLLYDLIKLDRGDQPSWTLFYPSPQHPSYQRIMTQFK